MTAYTTDTEVKKLLVGIQPATAYGSVDFAKVISRAQNKIDSMLAVRYSVPFATVPPRVGDLCTELAAFLVYRILLATNKALGDNAAVWQRNCDETLQDIRDIADRKAVLVNSSGAEVSEKSSAVFSTTSGKQTVFDTDAAENWSIPASLLNDINTRREND